MSTVKEGRPTTCRGVGRQEAGRRESTLSAVAGQEQSGAARAWSWFGDAETGRQTAGFVPCFDGLMPLVRRGVLTHLQFYLVCQVIRNCRGADAGAWFTSTSSMGRMAGCQRRTVRGALATFAGWRWLGVEARPGNKGLVITLLKSRDEILADVAARTGRPAPPRSTAALGVRGPGRSAPTPPDRLRISDSETGKRETEQQQQAPAPARPTVAVATTARAVSPSPPDAERAPDTTPDTTLEPDAEVVKALGRVGIYGKDCAKVLAEAAASGADVPWVLADAAARGQTGGLTRHRLRNGEQPPEPPKASGDWLPPSDAEVADREREARAEAAEREAQRRAAEAKREREQRETAAHGAAILGALKAGAVASAEWPLTRERHRVRWRDGRLLYGDREAGPVRASRMVALGWTFWDGSGVAIALDDLVGDLA